MRILGKLSPYESEVIKLRSEGMTYPAIHKIITEKGCDGTVASLRMFMQKEKIRNQAAKSQRMFVLIIYQRNMCKESP